MKNGDLPAMPVIEETKTEQYGSGTYATAKALYLGLTKREMFAMAAMQGLLAKSEYTYVDTATDAVAYADALLAELERTK